MQLLAEIGKELFMRLYEIPSNAPPRRGGIFVSTFL
jgi:hypothetical protein